MSESTRVEGESPVVNRKVAARFLGISERLLWRLSASGAVPSVRLGSRVLYRKVDLERIIEKGGAR